MVSFKHGQVVRGMLATTVLVLGLAPTAMAASPSYQNTVTSHLPSTLNQLTSFDISFVDSSSSSYVLADRNNASVDLFDTQSDGFVRASDPLFTGLGTGPGCKPAGSGPNTNAGSSGGPNGVVIVSRNRQGDDEDNNNNEDQRNDNNGNHDRGQAWAGDGDSTVKVIDLNTGHQVGASIPTGGKCRADELWDAPQLHEIMIGNPNDPVVTQTFISTNGTPGPSSVLGQLMFDDKTGCAQGTIPGVPGTRRICHTTAATAGIEQPILALGHFWVAIGATTENPGGEVAEIDPDPNSPTAFQRVGFISVPCGPSGLTFIPPNRAAAACGAAGVQFLDLQSKMTVGPNVPETGGADEVWFANGNVYAPDSSVPPVPPTTPITGGCARSVAILTSPNPPGFTGGQTNSCLAVIDAGSMTVIAEVQLPANAGSHSVAADSRNHKVFVPVRDSNCSTPAGTTPLSVCPAPLAPTVPATIPPCPVPEEGGCIHDQGIAVVQLVQ
jgi:hypothetical protein